MSSKLEHHAEQLGALGHPVRLAILLRLQQHGPSTATALSPQVGASPSVTSWHLRHLGKHGLVHDAPQQGSGRERWWRAAHRWQEAHSTRPENFGSRFSWNARKPSA